MEKYVEPGPCNHCKGQVKWFPAGDRVMLWCDTCGGNNPERPPNIELTFSPEKPKN